MAAPHIALVLLDDVGFADVGYAAPDVISPNIDGLAASGLRLGRHYTYMWCAPSRAALLTGRYPSYTGVYNYSGAQYALPAEFSLLPQLLRPLGYSTHAVGKWHLGFRARALLPTARGFDSFFGFLNGGEDHYSHEGAGAAGCSPVRDLWDSAADGPARNVSFFPRYSTYIYGERAAEIILSHPPTAPLFLYLALQNAHTPAQVPKEYLDRYPSLAAECPWSAFRQGSGFKCTGRPGKFCACNRLVVAAMVSAADDAIGKVVSALQRQQMWHKAVLVVAGDNGGPQQQAHWNGGLRGGKWTLFEGGVRPAAFVHSPLLPSAVRGRWHNGTIHLVDWLPTLYRLAGGYPAHLDGIDGVDQWDALTAASSSPRNVTLISRGVLLASHLKLYTVRG